MMNQFGDKVEPRMPVKLLPRLTCRGAFSWITERGRHTLVIVMRWRWSAQAAGYHCSLMPARMRVCSSLEVSSVCIHAIGFAAPPVTAFPVGSLRRLNSLMTISDPLVFPQAKNRPLPCLHRERLLRSALMDLLEMAAKFFRGARKLVREDRR
jgi:hypothetical protein